MPTAVNLPTLEKTWEIIPQAQFHPNTADAQTAGRRAWIRTMALLMDKLYRGYGGTFAAGSMGGDTRITFDQVEHSQPWLGPADLTAAVGKQFVVDAGTAISPANEGSFTVIAADAGGAWLEYNNGSAVFEADTTVSCHVRGGNFTTPPCRVKGTGAGTTGKGSGMDGRDRWLAEADLQSSTSAAGNRSWIALEFVNGSESLIYHESSSGSWDWVRAWCFICPDNTNGGFTGGTASVMPTVPADAFGHIGDTSSFWGDETLNSDTNYITVMASDDGVEWRFMMNGNDTLQTLWWGGEIRDHYDDGSAAIPSPVHGVSGIRPWIDFSRAINTLIPTYANFNDGLALYHTIDRDSAAGGPYVDGMYMTAEMVTTAMLGQHQGEMTDQLTAEAQEWGIYKAGLFGNTVGRRGHVGRPVDIFWGNENIDVPPLGSTIPNDGTRQFIKLGYMVFPWDGATTWRRN